MIKDKRRSLDRAVWNSYQAASIKHLNSNIYNEVRALINPNKMTQDYDEKILSVGFEYGFKSGDIFEWLGTNTHWLIYMQDINELAYFRGLVRKCTYQITWEDEKGAHTTYAAIQGPEQRTLSTRTAHNLTIDIPNYSLALLVPKTEENIKFFQRYTKFFLQNDTTCWRVEAVNAYSSTSEVLEVYAKEYYANKDEDDISNGIVGALIPEPVSPNTKEEESDIRGETFIQVKQKYEYRFNGNIREKWTVDKKYPVKLIIDPKDPRKLTLEWTSSYSGQFDLHYGDYSKTIVVESLF